MPLRLMWCWWIGTTTTRHRRLRHDGTAPNRVTTAAHPRNGKASAADSRPGEASGRTAEIQHRITCEIPSRRAARIAPPEPICGAYRALLAFDVSAVGAAIAVGRPGGVTAVQAIP